jgi:hypothetical protein
MVRWTQTDSLAVSPHGLISALSHYLKGLKMRRPIVSHALAIPEMMYAFDCICGDDKKTPDDYTDTEIVSEAEYRLITYFEDGHVNNDEMRLSDDQECKKIAQNNIKMLKAFIKKYKTIDSQWSKYTNHLI